MSMKTECFRCGARFDGYPRVGNVIRCPECGSFEVHVEGVGVPIEETA